MKEKQGFLAPKQVANRIKAKGLQKLRWYCQMCNKQCRDENGFKCHCMSDSHQRQMQLFSENSTAFMDEFSEDFERGMMEIIRRKARSQRCSANMIYKEYIADKHHFHMNATIWETLTDFVMYLGRKGLCEVDETEKGWFVTWIDRDPETLRKVEAKAKRERTDLDSEEKHMRDLERQVKAARAAAPEEEFAGPSELKRNDPDEKVSCTCNLSKAASGKAKLSESSCSLFSASGASSSQVDGRSDGAGGHSTSASSTGDGSKSKGSAIEALMAEEMKRKDTTKRTDYWLVPGIVVKVMNKDLRDGKFYKQKGTVLKVFERYTAHVRLQSSGDELGPLLKLDQDDLETVIPTVGGRVMIVNGAYRGETARLTSLDIDAFCVAVRIEGGPYHGHAVNKIDYEDVCKLASYKIEH
mmetsp:Transcript_7481/g.12688  ORF Transcript_7481/g.12688 Transcript_7481/m.12688 type:complete len:412 (+) Transcript_7481:66-1301(+)|eukprot:CAMPEP_0119323214 /NCGR_PEP_ID=MMETSP1333-20130426/60313_1 /TAXON_ID=418940 /ORGANISM="Scyphosphaera apsteinii, Strain RCC1455" /LENGTH=411 /DNA_ID=CAMNT_0007330609 /DNA_START=65 /DNA_END=1300 /DNA_ORIENTATION=-